MKEAFTKCVSGSSTLNVYRFEQIIFTLLEGDVKCHYFKIGYTIYTNH